MGESVKNNIQDDNIYRLFGCSEVKKPLRKLRLRCEDLIKMKKRTGREGVHWIQLTEISTRTEL
jgi:hypothetical protein